jgi:hypothetical protein
VVCVRPCQPRTQARRIGYLLCCLPTTECQHSIYCSSRGRSVCQDVQMLTIIQLDCVIVIELFIPAVWCSMETSSSLTSNNGVRTTTSGYPMARRWSQNRADITNISFPQSKRERYLSHLKRDQILTACRNLPAAPIVLSWISRWIEAGVILQEAEPPLAHAMAPSPLAVSVTSKRVKGGYVLSLTVSSHTEDAPQAYEYRLHPVPGVTINKCG